MSVAEVLEYRPTEDEPFMNPRQREYFRQKLETLEGRDPSRKPRDAREPPGRKPEPSGYGRPGLVGERPGPRARTRDRQRKLIAKIDSALKRIEDGTYGYCEETGDPIGIARLDARPIATLSLEAQEMHERREKVYRDE